MINEPVLKKININHIKIDPDNPNKMNKKTFEALKNTIQKYGYLVPLILDKNLKIADGEHRYLAYKDLGMTEIPSYILDISDPDRRILRQVMNKLKGEHDYIADLEEYHKILEHYSIEDFSALLGQNKEDMARLLNGDIIHNTSDEWKEMPEFNQEDVGSYRQLIISFRNKKDLDEFLKIINQRITNKTKSIWFPPDDREKPANYLWTYIEKEDKSV